jgi:hypothetical protein
MTFTPLNLNKARKVRAKETAKVEAAQNRVRFGRSKSEKTAANAKTAQVRSILDGAKRER